MVDIASLAIKIDTSDVSKAAGELGKLGPSAGNAERATKGVSGSLGAAAKAAGVYRDSLGRLREASGKLVTDARKVELGLKGVSDETKRLEASTGKAAGGLSEMGASMRSLAGYVGVAFGVREIAQAAEQYANLSNRLKQVTDGTAELAFAQQSVFQIAQESRQSLETTASVYQRIAQNGKQLGLSFQEVASITETVAKSVALSGASADSANASLMQFGQALASGVLRGEELNSILEQTPALAQTIARGLGVTTGELRKLGEEGALSSARVIEALENQKEAVDELAGAMTVTGGQAITAFNNSLVSAIGKLDEASGASKAFAEAVLSLSRALDGFSTGEFGDFFRDSKQSAESFNNEISKTLSKVRDLYGVRDRLDKSDPQDRAFFQMSFLNREDIDRRIAELNGQADKLRTARDKLLAAGSAVGGNEAGGKDPATTVEQPAEIKAILSSGGSKAPKAVAYADDAATRMLAQLRQQEASLAAQLAGNDKLSAAQQAQVQFAQQIADLKEKRILTAEQQSLLANKDAIAAQLAENVALDEQLRKREQINDLERLRIQIMRGSGQNSAANAAQFELDYAKQRAEYERQGNVEAIKRLETLREIQKANETAGLPSGTVEGVGKAPRVGGLSPEVGGASGELIRLEQERAVIDDWRTTELEKQMAFLEAKAINEQVYAERVRNINEQAAEAQSNIASSMFSAQLGAASNLLGDLASITAQAAGEQSALYGVMFAAQKAFAVAQTIINAEMASAAALAPPPIGLGPVAGLPYSQVIRGMGYASAAVIGAQALMGMAHSGIDSVPREGTWLLDKGERVVDSRTNQDLKRYLTAANEPSSSGGGMVVNLNEDASRAGSTQMRNVDGKQILDVFVSNIRQDGHASKAIQQAFGVRRAGR